MDWREPEETPRSEAGEREGRRKDGDWKGIELTRRIAWQAGGRRKRGGLVSY